MIVKCVRERGRSVARVIVAYFRGIVLEVRPEGLPDGWRVGGGGVRERGKGKNQTEILRFWPEQLTGWQCHMTEQEGLGEAHCGG